MLLNMVMFKVTICDFGKMNINMTDKIEKKEATFAVPYNGEDNNDYVDGKGFCCNDGSLEAAHARALSRAAKNNFQERYCFDNPTKFVDLLGLFETISQAKEYRAMNGIKGRIQKNEDGTYSINPIHSARFKKK